MALHIELEDLKREHQTVASAWEAAEAASSAKISSLEGDLTVMRDLVTSERERVHRLVNDAAAQHSELVKLQAELQELRQTCTEQQLLIEQQSAVFSEFSNPAHNALNLGMLTVQHGDDLGLVRDLAAVCRQTAVVVASYTETLSLTMASRGNAGTCAQTTYLELRALFERLVKVVQNPIDWNAVSEAVMQLCRCDSKLQSYELLCLGEGVDPHPRRLMHAALSGLASYVTIIVQGSCGAAAWRGCAASLRRLGERFSQAVNAMAQHHSMIAVADKLQRCAMDLATKTSEAAAACERHASSNVLEPAIVTGVLNDRARALLQKVSAKTVTAAAFAHDTMKHLQEQLQLANAEVDRHVALLRELQHEKQRLSEDNSRIILRYQRVVADLEQKSQEVHQLRQARGDASVSYAMGQAVQKTVTRSERSEGGDLLTFDAEGGHDSQAVDDAARFFEELGTAEPHLLSGLDHSDDDLFDDDAQLLPSHEPTNASPVMFGEHSAGPELAIIHDSRPVLDVLQSASILNGADIREQALKRQQGGEVGLVVVELDGSTSHSARMTMPEQDREQQLCAHFNERVTTLMQQSRMADSKAVEFQVEWQRAVKRLEQTTRDRADALRKYKEALDELERTKDELQTIRDNYESQIGVLSDHTVTMTTALQQRSEEVESIKSSKVHCERCKQWNTVRWLITEGGNGKRCAGGNHPSSYNFA
eukprot:TRINITY_DN7684_c0_g3_i1.p2 TRINITY_DN7684_c0_g3~~TRINITY_DN7684_c0_g3_i1.p2  ORF type:complete len:707 (+),score=149.55 TRINITY_DN7684_c0_g3_i1:470-2590(+)